MSLNRIVPEMIKSKKSKKVLFLSPSRMPRNTLLGSHASKTMTGNRGSSDQITFNGTQNRLKNKYLLRNVSTCGSSYGYSLPLNGEQKPVRKGHSITKVPTGTGDVGGSHKAPDIADADLPVWHKMTVITFESFLHQIDWILSKLQIKEYTMLNFSNSIPRYEDVCQKLRIEILLAIDKLNLLTIPNFEYTKEEGELLHNLSNLKGQLSDLRRQYHSLIKNFGSKVNKSSLR